ncbi:MAG: S8 family serine peptidase [Crocinitomicaceae bacterium]|nr:S8 family serine peptidase [Crocinitomicaceae bacterium]
MKHFFLSLALSSIAFLSYAQTAFSDYQDGKVIFEIPSSMKMFKTFQGVLEGKDNPFLGSNFTEFGIFEVVQLHPNIKDEKLLRTYEIRFSEFYKVNELLLKVKETIDVVYVEKKELHKTFLTPNDTYFTNSFNNGMWCLYQVNAPQAWDISTGDANIVVAVTDNAIQVNHPDLVNKIVPGRDVVDNDNDPSPCGGNDGFHGSHVSGTVGAETNNNLGVASLGYNISVMPIKIGNCSTGALTGGYDGIIWAADNGADAINMSWGGGGVSTYGQNVCNYAWNAGVILIAAAGNDNTNQQFYPAAYENVVSVAATTNGDAKSSFSQYGTWIDVAAPGSQILSTNEGTSYQMSQGTSMASPMVASLVGLMLSHAPSATPQDIIDCLLSSADNIDAANGNYLGQLGSGRINAEEALICLSAFTYSLDAGITGILNPEGSLCTATVNPEFELRNYGSQTLNSVTLTYQYDGGASQTINWTGSLSQGGTEIIQLPAQTLGTGPHTLTVSCTSPNGGSDQNASNNSQSSAFNIIPSGQIVTVEIVTDCWGSETQWTITDPASSEVVANGGPYTDITGGEVYQSEVCLAAGCYEFTITDAYGDGMYGSQYGSCSVDGTYNLSQSNGTVVASILAANSDFGDEEVNPFCVVSNLGYDIGVSDISYPKGTICNPSVEAQVEVFNYGASALSSFDISYDFGLGIDVINYQGSLAPGTSVIVLLPVVNVAGGANSLEVTVSNPDGNTDENGINDLMSTSFYVYDSYQGLPFTENFESNSFVTNDWYLTNSDNDITWEIVTVDGTTPGNKAAKIDFFNYSNGGERDGFQTAPFDFGAYTNIQMTFEHAFRRYNQESRDSLAIMISTDCGESFSYLGSYAEDGTGSFATAYTSDVEFVPATGDWCMGEVGSDCLTIDLNAYSGMAGVIIRFESVNNGIAGNNLFIDNINISGDQTSSPPTANFNGAATLCLGDLIQFDNNSLGATSQTWDFGDGNSSSAMNPTHEYTSAGNFTVQLTVTNNFGTDTYSQNVSVSEIPTVEITSPFSNVCNTAGGFSLSATPLGGSFSGPGVSGSTFTPSNAGVGSHVVSYSYTNGSGCSASSSLTIVVDNCANLMQPELEAIVLYPNPNKGSFTVDGLPETGSIFVYTVEGKLVTYHRIEGQTQIINLSRPIPGIYRVQIQTPQGDRIFKMIIS